MVSVRKKVLTNISPNERNKIAEYWGKKQGALHSVDLYQYFRAYKFNYIEYGNYNNQFYRNKNLYDLLQSCDYVLKKLLKTKNLGFDYKLSVAFGSRGYPKTLAHFAPTTMFINLNHKAKTYDPVTKKVISTEILGIDSFAHEYAHALDYFLGRYVEPITLLNYLSDSWKFNNKTPLRESMSILMLTYYESQSDLNPLFLKDLRNPKKDISNKNYWESPVECWARISEQCLLHWVELTRTEHNYITHSKSTYDKYPNVYMPKAVLDKVFPFWLEMMNIIGLVLKGKPEKEIQKVANKESKQGTLFAKTKPKNKTSEIKKSKTKSKKK